jgi:phage terminase large subunit-like protein
LSRRESRGDAVIRFIQEYCRVPEGAKVGQRIVLAEFQKDFIRAIYDNPHGTRRAIKSISRKNGKTAEIACLLIAHICGPESKQNSQIVSGAMSRDQAALVFGLAAKMIALDDRLANVCRIIPSGKKIIGLARNVEYKALAAEGTTAHGLSPVMAIIDEAGQIKGPTNPFIEAILTSQGAHENPLQIFISTQAASDADFFSILIDDAIRSEDPHTVLKIYRADEGCDLLDRSQWKKANPALGIFRSEADLEQQLKQAARLPAMEASARNLLLNQRVAMESLWIAPAEWKKCGVEISREAFNNGRVFLGLDLSARSDLTAAIAATRDDEGFVHLLPFVFCPVSGIEERAQRDRAPYAQWVKDGHLIPIGGATMDYSQIMEYLRDALDDIGVDLAGVEFDRWRIDIAKKAAEDCGFAQGVEWRPVGQGFKDFSPRCEAFMALLLNGKLRHGNHPLLNMAVANAIAVYDPTGSVKLDKSKATQRIDPLIAAVMAAFPCSDGQSGNVQSYLSDTDGDLLFI